MPPEASGSASLAWFSVHASSSPPLPGVPPPGSWRAGGRNAGRLLASPRRRGALGGWSRLSRLLRGCLAPGLHCRLLPEPGKRGQATPPGPSLSRQKVLSVQPGAEGTILPPFWEQAPFCPRCQEATLGKDGLPSGP